MRLIPRYKAFFMGREVADWMAKYGAEMVVFEEICEKIALFWRSLLSIKKKCVNL